MKRLTLFLLVIALVLSCSKNTAPVIERLYAEPDSVKPGDTVILHCSATDRDGDKLTFTWYYKSNPLPSAVWQVPDNQGNYCIQLTVTDDIDIVKDSLLVKVRGQSLFRDSRDGKAYRYISIGMQTWMAENLAYLPSVGYSSRGSNTEPLYYVYANQESDLAEAKASVLYKTYGALYNWAAAKTACPAGWHLPTDEEWKMLEKYLGMNQSDLDATDARLSGAVGHQIRETGTEHWKGSNTGSTNSTGFTALPGGAMAYNIGYTGFMDLGGAAYFWSATTYQTFAAWTRFLYTGSPTMDRHYVYGSDGQSVRCVKDE